MGILVYGTSIDHGPNHTTKLGNSPLPGFSWSCFIIKFVYMERLCTFLKHHRTCPIFIIVFSKNRWSKYWLRWFLLFIILVMGAEPRTTLPELHPVLLFWDRVLVSCLDSPWICDPPAFATQVAGIIVVMHHHAKFRKKFFRKNENCTGQELRSVRLAEKE